MQTPVGLKRLPPLVLLVVLVCTVMPLLLHFAGVHYGPAARGGAGSHYAGIAFPGGIVRMDVAAAGLLMFLVILGILHYRVAANRFVNIMATTMLLAGLALTVQIVPCTPGPGSGATFAAQVVPATSLAYLGFGLILLNGTLFYRFTRLGHTVGQLVPVAACAAGLLGLTWAAMAGLLGDPAGHLRPLQTATLGLLVLNGILIRPQLRPRIVRFMKLGLTAMLMPLAAGVMWLMLDTGSIFDEGFHVAGLLWWLALLLPVLGLGIDFINAYYGKGLAGERRFLRQVIDAIPHFVFARDPEGRFTLVNKAVADFYDLSVTQIEGRHLAEIHDDAPQTDHWLAEDAQVLAEGRPVTMLEAETRAADGTPIWINAIKTPLPGRGRQSDQVLGISIDVSRQKRAELALAERLKFEQTATSVLQQFIRCTVDNFDAKMPGIMETLTRFARASRFTIYRTDPGLDEARLLYAWRPDQQAAGSEPPARLAGDQIRWLDRWFSLNKPLAVARRDQLPQEAAAFRHIWDTSDSGALLALPIWRQDTLFGFLGLDGDRTGPWTPSEIALLRNIADLFITVWTKLETERNLTRAMQEATASSKAKSEFLANMSHEIRTPMNCVIGISDLLMEMDPTAAQKQYLEMISHSGAALLTLINDILDLSKIEAGQLELETVETDLRDMVEEVAGLIAFHAQAKGLEMVCRYAPGAPDLVRCDPGRLRQVLTNLLNNAVKFTQEGHIYLNVEPVGGSGDTLELQFQVADTGIGIPPEKLDKIFEKFTQADTSTTRRFGGTGLGLSISRQLIELMGGRITADSIEGRGSTFSFTVPLPVVADTLQAPAQVEDTDTGILVVSNHELGCEVLAEQVRHLGYRCTTALGCQEGRRLLDRQAGELGPVWSHILIDQDAMPEKTCLLREFLEQLPADNRPRLVLMTSLSSIHREQDLAARGFSGTLTKPVRPRHLARILAEADEPGSWTVEQVVAAGKPSLVPDPAITAAQPETDGPRVLLAEDNPFNQKVATGMLQLLGCRVEVAANGRQALELLQEQEFELVFMDCQMPEMDGYAATRRIRELPGRRGKTPVIAMTANALSGDREACFAAGMDDFLSKPITKVMLTEMLAKWGLVAEPAGS